MLLQTEMPFYEGVEDALSACVRALGGAKVVGAILWPDKPMEEARTLLLNCLNPNRKEKLDYTQIIWVFREAKRVGFYAGFQWFARECEFESRAVTSEEEMDRLANVIEASTKTLANSIAKLERMRSGS